MKDIFPIRYVVFMIIFTYAILWYVNNVEWYGSTNNGQCQVVTIKALDKGYAFCKDSQ